MEPAPLERFKKWLRAFVVHHAHGPYATPFLFVFSLTESIVLPFPVELVLTPLVVVRARTWWYYALVTTVASVIGGLIGYGIGVLFFDAIGEPLVAFYGLSDELARVDELLIGSLFVATFLAAFTPAPWKLYALSAGALSAPLGVFLVASVLGRAARFFLYSYIVDFFGALIARLVLRYFTILTIAAAFVFVIAAFLFVW